MVTAVVLICLFSATCGVCGWTLQASRKDELEKKLEGEKRLLSERCEKLADHVLWMERDKTLGGEMTMALIPSRCPEFRTTDLVLPGGHVLPGKMAQASEHDQIDVLLDVLEIAEVTGVKSEKHSSKEVNKVCEGQKPLVTLEFGDVSVRELVWGGRPWTPDLCWKGHLLPELSGEQVQRLRQIFRNRMAEAALKGLVESTKPKQKVTQQDVDDAFREAQLKLYKGIANRNA